MYDPKTGIYFVTSNSFPNEEAFVFENTYYIRYNSKKALYAFEQLHSISDDVYDSCLLSHIYLDLLFESVGMIINRFVLDRVNGNRKKQHEMNRIEYDYNNQNYPLLNDKNFRNFIEHIDERDEQLIDAGKFFGTFNVIFPTTDESIKQELSSTTKEQNNLLDLQKMTYTIIDTCKGKENTGSQFIKRIIDLNALKAEIERIHRISEIIWGEITNPQRF